MLASINPLVERARGTRFSRTFAWYLAGSVLAAGLVGAALGVIGAGLRSWVEPSQTAVAVVVVAVCCVGVVLDLGLFGVRLPSTRRQVNENWLATYRGWLYGFGFGFQLGLGAVTVVSTSAVYVMFALEALSGSLGAGLIIGITFGAARALPLLAVSRVHDPEGLRAAMRRVHGLGGVVDLVARGSVVLLGAAGAAALVI